MKHLMTSSRYRSWLRCPRHHHYAYKLGYRAIKSSAAIVFGRLFHKALEAWWIRWMSGDATASLATSNALDELGRSVAALSRVGVFVDSYVVVQLEELVKGYSSAWIDQMLECKVLAVEAQFEGRTRIKPWSIAGKIDAIVKRKGRVYLVEHKTTGGDVAPGSSYWARLRMDPQISFYHYGGAILGHRVEGCIYDVIVKPSLKPAKATPPEKRKYRKDGQPYKGQRETDETLDEYRSRLAAHIKEHPESYYKHAEMVRLDSELTDARDDAYAAITSIQALHNAERIGPRNADACHRFGSRCEYFAVCSGAERIDDGGFVQEGPHPELS